MTFDELVTKIYEILPDAYFTDDETGQVIIHTGMRSTGEGVLELVPVEKCDG